MLLDHAKFQNHISFSYYVGYQNEFKIPLDQILFKGNPV